MPQRSAFTSLSLSVCDTHRQKNIHNDTQKRNAHSIPSMNTCTHTQTPSSLSESVIKGMRKAALETCCHHGNVVITTSSFPPGKNRPHSLLNSSFISPSGSLFLPILFADLLALPPQFLSSIFLPMEKSHSFISHSAFLTLHFQLFHTAPFSLPFCLVTLLLLPPSTTSTFKSEAKVAAMETNVAPDRLKVSCDHRNCRRCKNNLGRRNS